MLTESIERARREAAEAIGELHRLLIAAQRAEQERELGIAASPMQLLAWLTEAESFQWMRPFSRSLSVIALAKSTEPELHFASSEVWGVIGLPEEGTNSSPERERYLELVREDPEITLSHAQAVAAVAALRDALRATAN